MKTGYTNASGYNLAASAVRDGRRIITVVLGGRSTASRNAHVASLMDTGFEVERARANGQQIQVAQTFFEQRGFGLGPDNAPVQYASVNSSEDGEDTSVAFTALPAIGAQPNRVTPAPSERVAAPAPVQRAEARPADVTTILNGGVNPTPAPRTPPRAAPARPAREPAREPAGRWAVQVGAFRDETVARNWLTEVNRRFRSQFTNAERNVQDAAGW
jgi:D-alanyl-D-alanine carboxypeptidase (penicillin-binding protein 5/6)